MNHYRDLVFVVHLYTFAAWLLVSFAFSFRYKAIRRMPLGIWLSVFLFVFLVIPVASQEPGLGAWLGYYFWIAWDIGLIAGLRKAAALPPVECVLPRRVLFIQQGAPLLMVSLLTIAITFPYYHARFLLLFHGA